MIENFIALLFLARDYAHRMHLKYRSHAEHVVLGDFYEEIIDIADKLTEVYQGRNGIIDIPYMDGETGEPIEVLPRHLKLIESVRYQAVPKDDTAIQSIVDELVVTYLRTIYKLNRGTP